VGIIGKAGGFFFLAWMVVSLAAADPASAASPRPVKVLIISMFKPEGEVWRQPLGLNQEIEVPGLSPEFPVVRCNAEDVCQMTTSMGHANAAASVMAVVFSGRFDLTQTYFLIAGIAGIDPKMGTLGSAAWARYLVDFGITHEIDAREKPASWPSGFIGVDTAGPGEKPNMHYRTEVFQLNEDLLQWAYKLSANAVLKDNDQATAYRQHYKEAAATAHPTVILCDTEASDTYWHGALIGAEVERWTTLLTDGKGRYCTSQQEDNASLEALRRGAAAHLLDLNRVADLRTAANFDRPYPGQDTAQSMMARSGGFPISIDNLVIAGLPLITEITTHWTRWAGGIPPR
jgi:purine nucleoside permease